MSTTTFSWMQGRTFANYVCTDVDTGYERGEGVASVWVDKDAYRVTLSYRFDELVPPNAYILKKKYATIEAAKRAVDRKVPGLVAVLKIQGRWQ